MPELPEVETIRRGLETYVVGHTITAIEVWLAKQVKGSIQSVIGAKIIAARRFGKGLVLDCSNGQSIAIHVKMTGQLVYTGSKVPQQMIPSKKVGPLPGKATHVIFMLDQGAKLYYNDVRQFGWIHILPTESVPKHPFFASLGPEALHSLTLEKFQIIVAKSKKPIKVLLLEQQKMSGVGNIYANDALFVAGIHPLRNANDLHLAEVATLFAALETVLKNGIAAGGSSEWAYVDVLGQEGAYQKQFLVYGKDKTPCRTCQTLIQRITVGGRGTFYCPSCQK